METKNKLEIGITGQQNISVIPELTADVIGSGMLKVYATPAMIALMEKTARLSVKPYLQEGQGTVGIKVNVEHVAATPVGCEVRCETRLVDIDRRKLTFEVAAYDNAGLIGKGTHERFIIDEKKFQDKTNLKAKQ